MTMYGYAKVPPHTPAGTLESWRYWLVGLGCSAVFTDVGFSTQISPGWNALLECVEPGDTVRVSTLDQLGSRTKTVGRAVDGLLARGGELEVLNQAPPFLKAS